MRYRCLPSQCDNFFDDGRESKGVSGVHHCREPRVLYWTTLGGVFLPGTRITELHLLQGYPPPQRPETRNSECIFLEYSEVDS